MRKYGNTFRYQNPTTTLDLLSSERTLSKAWEMRPRTLCEYLGFRGPDEAGPRHQFLIVNAFAWLLAVQTMIMFEDFYISYL